MIRRPRDNNQAVAAFRAKKTENDAMLVRLLDFSADHFDISTDTLRWGHVGNLEHYASLRKRISDAAFQEGEHAA